MNIKVSMSILQTNAKWIMEEDTQQTKILNQNTEIRVIMNNRDLTNLVPKTMAVGCIPNFMGHVNIVIGDAFPIICPGREFHAELENRRTRGEESQERQRATGLFLLLIFHLMP